ncbi:ion channel [Methanolobus sediminis]|uniref:Ion channel n=1 Tax=Methanolobus sediminis TaxID=3072978 RepID=A0AA51ULQ7_9EURY|nr:ion channel [Methanolobus sediminis]WMW25884.1 ion channel [Methanolobus sediminis]
MLVLIVLSGILVYFIGGKEYGFSSLLIAVYWSFSTAFTIGYGDIVPHAGFAYTIGLFLPIFGYLLIIIPFLIIVLDILESFYCLLYTVVKD